MRPITIQVYKFSELSDAAKERAKTDYFSDCGYNWDCEAFESLEALAKHFGGSIGRYEIDYFGGYSYCDFSMPELTTKEIKTKLATLGSYNKRTGRGDGECVLTGYCFDESAIDGFRIAWRGGERDLDKLMEAAFRSWLKDVISDVEYRNTDEAFAEHCEANEYEFLADGSFYVAKTAKAKAKATTSK